MIAPPVRPLISVVAGLAAVALSGCGSPDQDTAHTAAPAPAPVVLSAEEKAAILTALPEPYNEGDLDNGRRVFARCRSCHTINQGGTNMTGPALWGVFGREAGTHPGYRYSKALEAADFVWSAQQLDQWLQSPRTFLPGNKMAFAGVATETDRRDVIAYLKVETGHRPQ